MYQFVKGKVVQTIPTLGVNHETIDFRGVSLECWDLGGIQPFRPLWLQYAPEASGVVFVVDSSDGVRLQDASDELHNLFGAHGANKTVKRDIPLLIYANKRDKPEALPVEYIEKVLHIDSLDISRVRIFPITALRRESLDEGMQWLANEMALDESSQ